MGSGSDDARNIGDPSLRLLSRVADFVEPLTRFDRGHLVLETSQHRTVELVARQRFQITFDFIRAEGAGDLPAGVMAAAGAQALRAESEAQLAAARASIPGRLSQWAAAHGEDPARRPSIADCFSATPELGHAEDCVTCIGKGKVDCLACHAAGTQECPTCVGKGSRPCNACDATGSERCSRCYGQGYEIVHRQEKVWDAATNSGRTQNVPHKETCGGCGGRGTVTCSRCSGSREVACSRCNGQRTIPCSTCSGAGSQTCAACEGAGRRHWTSRLACAIGESFELSARTSEADIAEALKSLASIGEVLGYSETHRSTAETGAMAMDRQTVASVPVTSIVVAVGQKRTLVHGFGPQQDIHSYGDIAGMLLSDDLATLEAALPATRNVLPARSQALEAALTSTLASEVNVAIAENPGTKGLLVVERDFSGLLSVEHMKRASAAIGKAVTPVYWSTMLRGPVAVLAMPLLQAPVEILLRNRGVNVQLPAMIGLMLLAFGGAILAHMLVVRLLQRRLAPSGTPKLSRVVSRRGHLRTWLIGAGAFIVLATSAVAALTRLMLA